MNFFKSIDENEIVDAVSFFPALASNPNINEKLTQEVKKLIDNKTKIINGNTKDLILSLLIGRYFALDKYSSLKDNDLLDWVSQFIIRKEIIGKLTQPSQLKSDCHIQELIYEILNKPVFDHSQRSLMYFNHFLSINDLSVADLYYTAEEHIRNGSFQAIENAFDSLIDEEDSVSNDEFNLLISPARDSSIHKSDTSVFASIDLKVNDDQLKQDFAEFLTLKRKELNIKPITDKKFKSGKLNSLINHRALQYLDVKICDLYINKKNTLEQHEYAEYIFPSSDTAIDIGDATEKIRKSTIPAADEMLSINMIRSMLTECKKDYPYGL